MTDKVWLVPHPTSQFEEGGEGVKKLARQNSLTVIDAKFKDVIDPKMVESKPPKLTPKAKPKKIAE